MSLIRPPTVKVEEEGVLAIKGLVNQMNCQYRDLQPDNAGIDGEIEIVENNRFTGKIIKCQIKAGKSYILRETKSTLKIRFEKKHIEQWLNLNVPIVVMFYHPSSKITYWKAVKEYFTSNVSQFTSESVPIIFDKVQDAFSEKAFLLLKRLVEGSFGYDKIICVDKASESILSNWFRVVEIPNKVYKAPTNVRFKREITAELGGYYAFILKDQSLLSFSNLNDAGNELSRFCDTSKVMILEPSEINESYFSELLNSGLLVNSIQKDLVSDGERFYFSEKILRTPASNIFEYASLSGLKEKRVKIYINKGGEYQHHAVKLKFHLFGNDRFLEINPDWYFSYRYYKEKTRRDIGIRITREKAGMYNKDYLYLLHFWKQFLSNNSSQIVLDCDSTSNPQKIIVNKEGLIFDADFSLFNDYKEPGGEIEG